MDMNSSKIEPGAVKIHKNVIASIASIAALEIEGVKQIGKPRFNCVLELFGIKRMQYVKVEFGRNNDDIKVEVPLIVKYGYSIPEIAESVQESVRQAVEKMLEKSPRDITINVQGIEKG